ncbi:MAG: nucleotidyltransferase family protein [Hyphomicrobiales bacterium]|nr:nucleotidyltransferase family protein [Hyphomicrobiales bacterium]
MAPVNKIAVILLAAGQGQRFRAAGGGDKLLARFQGQPMLAHAARSAVASGLPVLVVTGHAEAAVRGILAGLPLRFVHNDAFASGMASSLKAGIAALDKDIGAAIIMLGDMPEVGTSVLRALTGAFAANPAALAVIPVFQGRHGNPVLLAARAFAGVMALQGDQGARRLLAGRADVIELALDDAAILNDIDEPSGLPGTAS